MAEIREKVRKREQDKEIELRCSLFIGEHFLFKKDMQEKLFIVPLLHT